MSSKSLYVVCGEIVVNSPYILPANVKYVLPVFSNKRKACSMAKQVGGTVVKVMLSNEGGNPVWTFLP